MRSARSILVAVLALTVVAVPAAHAQQPAAHPPAASAAAPAPTTRLEPVTPTWNQPEPASRRAVAESRSEDAKSVAMREPSARTALAVVGAVVLVIALIALIR